MPSSKKPERVVKRKLADGSVKEYRYAAKEEAKAQYVDPDGVAALVAAYKMSPDFLALRKNSQKNYTHYLRDLGKLENTPAKDLTAGILLALRDAIAKERGHGAANVFMRVCATVLRWAVKRGRIPYSPVDRIEQLPGGHLLAWTREEADYAEAHLIEALRRVVLMARYTGQRRGDLIAMTWFSYDGRAIRLRQQKSRDTARPPLVIPVHPRLRAELDAWERTSSRILTSPTGAPWTADHLSHTLGDAMITLGMRPGLNVHGLRKLAASELANAGCTTHEIAAITGHTSLAMVELYTKGAHQERLAEAAIVRLEAFSNPFAERLRKRPVSD